MEKKQAQEYIKQVLNSRFDQEQFELFVRNLLNEFELKEFNHSGQLIPEAFRDHISHFKRLGVYTDPEGERMDVLVVQTKSVNKLERTRTALRNFVVRHLKNREKFYALVTFYSKEDDGMEWRLSLVKIDIETERTEKGKIKAKEEIVPAKRFSFLVGENENAHTAQKQLLPLLVNDHSNPLIIKEKDGDGSVEGAFSIEKVTDEFYEQYKELYLKLTENAALTETLEKEGLDPVRFVKKLLGQIVFLYFLQKKGWVGVSKDQKMGEGPKNFLRKKFDEINEGGGSYFNDFLRFIFYDALAKEHNDEGIKYFNKNLGCKIPFLNGGLFEADYENWDTLGLNIDNALFSNPNEKTKAGDKGTGILDVFDRYNFTIREDEPLEKEVAVDPEMLGKVFENLLDVTDRKSKGAFYTPREIVHYMCQESLIHYLDNTVNRYTKSYQSIDSDQASLFGGSSDKKGNLKIEVENKGDIRVPKEDIEKFIRHGHLVLEHETTVTGKGKETDSYKYKLPESIRNNAVALDKALADIKICDPAIGSGAFPVGLLHEIVIARLVLNSFLQKEEHTAYNLKRHAIQESIYGVDIDPSAIDIARLRLWLSMIVDEEDYETIDALPNLDYKIVCGNSLIRMPESAMRDLKVEQELEKLKEQFFHETDEAKKKALRQQINQKIRQLLDSAESFAGYNIDFDFKLFFSEVWHQKGGFDVVIGNPPYGAKLSKQVKAILRKQFRLKSSETAILFLELAFQILNDSGAHSYIIPKPFTYSSNYSKARKYVSKYLVEVIDCGKAFDKVKFEAVVIINTLGFTRPNYINSLYSKHIGFKYLSNIDKSLHETFGFYLNGVTDTDIEVANLILTSSGLLGEYASNERGGMLQSKLTSDGKYKVIGGKEIHRYGVKRPKGYLGEIDEIDSRAKVASTGVLVQNIVAHITKPTDQIKIISCIPPSSDYIILDTINQIKSSESSLTKEQLWAILNSELINWYCYRFVFGKAIRTMHFDHISTKKIPVPIVTIKKVPEIDIVFESLHKYITFTAYKSEFEHSFFNALCNSIVYELYFEEQIRTANKQILPYLGDLKPITDEMSEEEKLAIIQSEFERLYDPNHPVRNNLETLDSVEEVRVIKEALKS